MVKALLIQRVVLVLLVFCGASGALMAQSLGHEASQKTNNQVQAGHYDCTDFYIDEAKSGILTVEEQVAALDDVFYQSVDRYQRCMQETMSEQNTAQSNSAGGAGAAAEGAQAQAGTQESSEQTAEEQSAQNNVLDRKDIYPQQTPQNASSSSTEQDDPLVPEDIPPADNDTVLQRQIREAAMAEQDPEKKKKLWDLYRKYKGK